MKKILIIFSLFFLKTILSAENAIPSETSDNNDVNYIEDAFQITKEGQIKALANKIALDLFVKSDYFSKKYKNISAFNKDIKNKLKEQDFTEFTGFELDIILQTARFYFKNQIAERNKIELSKKFTGDY